MVIVSLPAVSIAKITIDNPLQKSWQCSGTAQGTWQCVAIDDKTRDLFKKNILPKEKNQIIADALGWISVNDPQNICGGYYYQTPIQTNLSPSPNIQFQQAEYPNTGNIIAEGTVEVTKGSQYLSADKAVLKRKKGTQQIENVDVSGNVNLSQPGQLAISQYGTANIINNTATLNDAYYLIRVREKAGTKIEPVSKTTNEQDKNFTGFAHGHADEVIQKSKTNYTLKDVTYATGNPYDDAWMLSATTLDIDRDKETGSAYNMLFYVKNVPILYWPYMTFPISNTRKTGFLYPTAGYNGDSGYYVSTPFYWNMAPNYDLLLTPTLYNHRGLLLDGDFRYLTQAHSGNLDLQYMPYDRLDKSDRRAVSFTDHGNYGNHLSSFLNYQYIGDKDFYNDFDSDNMGLSTQTLLNRQASIAYNDQNWTTNATIQAYDVIDDSTYLANRPYWTLPQINANANYPDAIWNMNFSWNNQFTYFYKPSLDDANQVQGQRLYSAPKLALPLSRSWGFFTPSLALSETVYDLQNRQAQSLTNFSQNEYPDQYVNRTLPIINIDTGLYFDRSFSLNNTQYTQTLEPRLFYTYIPYQNQSNIPLFDTSLTNFNYASLFQTNIFSGLDRLNNANQLSYALQTAIDDSKGNSILSAGIGQIAYFANRDVSLCSGTNEDCSGNENKIAYYNSSFSDIAGFANYAFLPDWHFITNMTYNQNNNNVDSQTYQFQYLPDQQHIFNIGYENYKNDYASLTPDEISQGIMPSSTSQFTISSLWKLTPHWSVAGLWSYSFNSKRTTNMFAGLQYDACSWAVRFLAQRYVSNSSDPNQPTEVTGPLNNAYVIQFELKGLGGSSTSSLNERLGMISGFDPNTSNFN